MLQRDSREDKNHKMWIKVRVLDTRGGPVYINFFNHANRCPFVFREAFNVTVKVPVQQTK